MSYHIEVLNDDNSQKWEEFNRSSVDGSFFHTLKWKEILGQIEGVAPRYFLFFRNNDLKGILPCTESRIPFFKGYLPIPYSDFNHCILHDEDPVVLQHVLETFREKNSSYVALNTLHQEMFDIPSRFPQFPFLNFGNMVIDLKKFPPETIWENFPKKIRQRIRLPEKDGFTIKEVNSPHELEVFYKFYAQNIRHIRGTLLPYSHFEFLWNRLFPSDMRITLLSKDEIIAGGSLSFTYMPQKTVYGTYLALNRNLKNTYSPSYNLWWETINWAWNRNFGKISFGRQKMDVSNPRYRIKSEFGTDFIPMYSKIFSLSRIFTLAYRGNQSVEGLRNLVKERIRSRCE